MRFLQKLGIKKTSIRVDNIREVGTEKTCNADKDIRTAEKFMSRLGIQQDLAKIVRIQ